MTPAATFDELYLSPALGWFATILPSVSVNRDVHVFLLAAAGQESGWRNVAQAGEGSFDRGLGPFQMQENTCADIMSNLATDAKTVIVCAKLGIVRTSAAVYAALLAHPNLATAFARLDLYADPSPVPDAAAVQGGWETYLRVWRPGDPRPADWITNHAAALAAVPQETK